MDRYGDGPPGGRLTEYRAWMRAADRPDSTIGLRCYHLQRVTRELGDPLGASTEDLITWLAGQDWSTETRRSYRSSLRSYYRWAHQTGIADADHGARLPVIRPHSPLPRPAGEDAIANALAAAEPRVRLMIRLGAQAGLRRGEIARVHTADLERDLGGWSLRVHGKGRRQRHVPLLEGLAATLRGHEPGWVFPSPAGGHLTPAHVGRLVSAALGPGVTSHQLRHRFATRAYAHSADLFAVQQLLGHAKPETTMIYTQIPDAAKRRIVDNIAA